MVLQPSSKFNLYEFFSILLPGSITLLMLFPFLPDESLPEFLTLFLILVIAGYSLGHLLHTVSIEAISYIGGATHRDQFVKELRGSGSLPSDTLVSFMLACQKRFNLAQSDSPIHRPQNRILEPRDCSDYYELVRTYINIDGRGRSRTYQALYSFSRSILMGSLIAGIIYAGYILLLVFEDTPQINIGPKEVFWYTPYIQTVNISAPYLAIILFGLGILIGRVFLDTMRNYRTLFATYMISDYLMIIEYKQEETNH